MVFPVAMMRGVWAVWLPIALTFVSMTAAWVLWAIFVEPVDTPALQPPDGPDWYGASFLLPLAAVLPIALVARQRATPGGYALAAVLVPLVMAAVAMSVQDERTGQREAKRVFAAYTDRFPQGRLSSVRVREQASRYLTVCADEVTQYRWFCVEVNLNAPSGQEVQGGFRRNLLEGSEPYDCFRQAIACGE